MSFGGSARAGKQEEPSAEKVGYKTAAKKKRPALVGSVAGLAAVFAVGVGTALANWGGATITGAIVGAASGAAGMYATHAASSAAEGQQAVEGSSGAGSATVDDVVAAVRGVVKNVQDGAANKVTDVKTQIESALGRMMAAVDESSQGTPAKIEQSLLAAIREADEVHRHCEGAIERAERWASGL